MVGEPLGHKRTQAGWLEIGDVVAVLIDAPGFKQEDVGERDGLALHTHNLGDVRDSTGSVTQPGELNDHVDCRCNLLTNSSDRQIHTSHQHQRFETGYAVSWAVGVQRSE